MTDAPPHPSSMSSIPIIIINIIIFIIIRSTITKSAEAALVVVVVDGVLIVVIVVLVAATVINQDGRPTGKDIADYLALCRFSRNPVEQRHLPTTGQTNLIHLLTLYP